METDNEDVKSYNYFVSGEGKIYRNFLKRIEEANHV